MRRWIVVSLCLFGVVLLGACGSPTFHVVNPRPSVVIDPKMGKLALELGTVPDQQKVDRLTVLEIRQSLQNGFQNLAGPNFTKDTKQAELVLHIDEAQLSKGSIGNLGAYLTIRFKASWSTGSGEQLAAFAGVAEPRNVTEPGPRVLEDAIEVMLEQSVQALEKVQGVKTRE
jgi:hypothetical protein